MAKNATISNTQHQRATLESIQKFGAENTPLDLRTLIDSITDNNETEALKAAENIFSGSPTNTKRFIEIHDQITQGIGHTTHVAAYNSASNTLKEQEKEKRSADFAFLNMLNIQRDTIDLINRIIESSAAIHMQTVQYAESAKDNILDIHRYAQQNFSADTTARSEQHTDKTNDNIDDMIAESQKIIDEQKALADEMSKKATDLPTEAQKILNELMKAKNDIESADTPLKRDWHEQKIADLKARLATHCHDKSANALQSDILSILERTHENIKALQDLQDKMQEIKTLTAQLNTDLQNGMSEAEYLTRMEEISSIKAEFAVQQVQTQALTTKNNAFIEEKSQGINELENAVAELKVKQQEIQEVEQIINESVGEYQDRHEQISKEHDDGILNWMKDNVGVENIIEFINKQPAIIQGALKSVGFDPTEYETIEDLAKEYIAIRPSFNWLLGESETVKAWENSITHNGEHVYRVNDNGSLYTYDQSTGTRTFITDPAVIKNIYAQAYGDEVHLFRNETPFSEDPDNTFSDTAQDINLTAENTKRGFKQHATDASAQQIDKAQERLQEAKIQSAAAPIAGITDTFKAQAPDIPRSTSDKGLAFKAAASAPSLLNSIDNAQETITVENDRFLPKTA